MSKKLLWSIAIISMLAIITLPSIASGEQSYERKIVVFDRTVNWQEQEARTKEFGPTLKRLPIINGVVLMLPPKAEASLASRPGVLRVEDDIKVFTLVEPIKSKPSQPAQLLPWGVDRINADLAWSASTASGVKVAVIDTGIDLNHPDLIANIKGSFNAIKPQRRAYDDNGHGTHVAGIIAAAHNQIGTIGAGHSANLYAVKALDGSGSGYTSDVIESIQWCINNGIQVANMSFATNTYSQALYDAVKTAYDAGLIMVAAAGNTGPGSDTVTYPAKFNEVIAVSATNMADAIPSWGSRGTEVDVAAPGSDIYSTYKDAGYATLSGTSMAAPHVTGSIALRLQISPGLTPSQALSLLKQTAEPLAGVTTEEQGAGLVNTLELITSSKVHSKE